jgi:hypothetical protein
LEKVEFNRGNYAKKKWWVGGEGVEILLGIAWIDFNIS